MTKASCIAVLHAGCDEWVELRIAQVHRGSVASMVLHNLRTSYKREVASKRKRPFSALEDGPDSNDDPEQQDEPSMQLKPEEAVLDVDMKASDTKRNSHAGWGFVIVANRQVADILVEASLGNRLNCAPPTKSLLQVDRHKNAYLTYSDIKRNSRDIALAKVQLPACGFGVVEVLHRSSCAADEFERSRPDVSASASLRGKQHRSALLWETEVSEVCRSLLTIVQYTHPLCFARAPTSQVNQPSL